MKNFYSRLLQSNSATLRWLCALFPICLTADFVFRREATYFLNRPMISTPSEDLSGEGVKTILGQPVVSVTNAKGEICGYKLC